MRNSAPHTATPAALFLALALALALFVATLSGCGLERATPAPQASAAPEATAPRTSNEAAEAAPAVQAATAPAFTAESVAHRLSVLVNDTDPSSPDFARLRSELVQAGVGQTYSGGQSLPGDLRLALSRVVGFNPPNMRERWQRHQQALDSAAALYAEHPPVDTDALSGAKVLRRLGPSLYLVRLQNGDTAFFSTPLSARRLKIGASLRGIPTLEKPHVKADRAKGDLVEELDEAGRTYVAITRQEAQRIKAERAPVLARLKQLEAER
ncbi:MAG: hypothetical protein Q8S17_06705, partial [Humidesulfovibrio sp.]|nr:hypothetical protein [Humidesulfovibrio sp.]